MHALGIRPPTTGESILFTHAGWPVEIYDALDDGKTMNCRIQGGHLFGERGARPHDVFLSHSWVHPASLRDPDSSIPLPLAWLAHDMLFNENVRRGIFSLLSVLTGFLIHQVAGGGRGLHIWSNEMALGAPNAPMVLCTHDHRCSRRIRGGKGGEGSERVECAKYAGLVSRSNSSNGGRTGEGGKTMKGGQ